MPLGFNQYTHDRAFEGTVANIQDYRHIAGTQEQYISGETGYLPFGRFVTRNATESNKVELPSAAGQTILGVAIYNDRFMASSDDPRVTGYPPLETVPVLKKGVVYLIAEDAIAQGGDIYVRHTEEAVPGTTESIGRARSDASGGNADLIPNTTYRVTEAVAAGEIFALHLDFSPVA